jgi:hypothetical protein
MESEVKILEGTNEAPQQNKVTLVVTVFEAIQKDTKTNGKIEYQKGSPIKIIECSHDGNVINHKGLINKFVKDFANFKELIKASKINKKCFFFESVLENTEGAASYKSTTALPVNDLTKLSYSMGLLITGYTEQCADFFEGGKIEVDEQTTLFLRRVFGDGTGQLLAKRGDTKAIEDAFKGKATLIKEEQKITISEVEVALLKAKPNLIPTYRDKFVDKLSNAKIDLHLAQGKLQDFVAELGEDEIETKKGAIEVLQKEVDKMTKKVAKAEAVLSKFEATFCEVA